MVGSQINRQLLVEIGIIGSEAYLAGLVAEFNAELNRRIVLELFQSLSVAEAKEFARLMESNPDNATISAFLDAHIPDHSEIASDEIDIMIGDIAENAAAYGEKKAYRKRSLFSLPKDTS